MQDGACERKSKFLHPFWPGLLPSAFFSQAEKDFQTGGKVETIKIES